MLKPLKPLVTAAFAVAAVAFTNAPAIAQSTATVMDAGPGKAVHCLLDDFNNFDDFAALVMALDLVISVQNTTVHMCGALGKTCWGMIPWRPEWRYGTDDHEMIWYSSVALYRQKSTGHWADVISLINSDLARLLGRQMNDRTN